MTAMLLEFDLSDQVAIVTGASRSIGRATASALAQAGAHTVLAGRSMDALEHVVDEVRTFGHQALAVECDVCDRDSVDALIERCSDELGPPDIVVANAGMFQTWLPSDELTWAEWDQVLATDLTGVMATCQAAGRVMIRAGKHGSIVTVSSIAGQVALAGTVAYTASKSGVLGLTKALAVDWAKHGIRVNALAPGFVEREVDPLADDADTIARIEARTPLARRGRPREVALAALFLASPAASFITGATVPVDGGWLAQ